MWTDLCHISHFQGEEIGMTDVYISWDDTKDPQACRTNPDVFDQVIFFLVESVQVFCNDKVSVHLIFFLKSLNISTNFSLVAIRQELQCNGMTQKMLVSV